MTNAPLEKPIVQLRRELTTPRSAAIAGILFAGLFGVCMLLIGTAFPSGVAASEAGDAARQADALRLALRLVPFAGIAFLWFIGVVRDLLGDLEDQFFSTVFFGSGLLFIAMTFIAAALAGGILAGELAGPESVVSLETLRFGRMVMYQISHNYAIRMAGVFMLSLGTIWYRTGLMPRWLAVLTFLMAVILLFTFDETFSISLVLPGWVLVISIFILVRNRRMKAAEPTPDA